MGYHKEVLNLVRGGVCGVWGVGCEVWGVIVLCHTSITPPRPSDP